MRFRLGLLLLPILAGIAFLPVEPAQRSPTPRLAVLVVFDQMRGDYLDRWQDLYSADGFRRLEANGARFTNCHYPYAMTATGPGHASILSGCSPDRHGIVANTWYDRGEAFPAYCATSARYERIPPLPKLPAPKTDAKKDEPSEKQPPGFGAPVRMLTPTLGDVVKEVTRGRGKVFGLSLKDRSAILPAGLHPDGCYWFDRGQFVTSTYFRDRLHPWVGRFNEERLADRWFGQSWTQLRPEIDYAPFSGPAEQPGAGSGAGQGRVFPHPLGEKKQLGSEYYSALANSPFGNDLLLDLAERAIVEEQLGQRDNPDLLIISFSSNDLVGHTWGPDSQEVMDVTLRSDLIVRDLLRFLDEQVGKGKYLLALTADHGICPLPEVAQKMGHPAGRIVPLGLGSAAEAHLSETLGKSQNERIRWIESATTEGGIYLNQRAIAARGLKLDDVAGELATWFATQPGMLAAYTRAQLLGQIPESDAIGKRVQKSFHPERSGDVLLVTQPYYFITSLKTGTTHGSPHPFDTYVPLVLVGPGIKPGRYDEAVTPQATAAILAHSLGLPAPEKAEAEVPENLR